ncbi:MAG: CBS domain-containing protein, partial [Parachlamydiaceae bacterium]|nr:CBS domain-containing protein [Parachlamydiaceae bacterium]
IIGVLCNPKSRLAALCDSIIHLPFNGELCPFDIAPTISTTSQLLFGDLLTIALMKHKKFTLDDYGRNHPSGRIGRRILLKVKDLMLTGDKIPICKPGDLLQDVLVELSNKRLGCILVCDDSMKLLGIFTDGDLRRTLQQKNSIFNLHIHEVMSNNPKHIHQDVLAWDAMKLMESDEGRRITILPVIDENRSVLGVIHLHDIISKGL